MSELRTDAHTGRRTFVVGSRQSRPNRPASGCPFCPAGLEAPGHYDVHWFTNRWPAMPDERCEVVLYTPRHDATFWSLGVDGAVRVIDLWADRSAALGARPDVAYVLVFENRGAEVGATIAHPHGQIYAFAEVPDLPLTELQRGTPFDTEPGDRTIARAGAWLAYVPHGSWYPHAAMLVPDADVPDLPSLDRAGRRDLATLLVDVLERFDRLFDTEIPYMLWIHQRPFDGGTWPGARLHVEIVSPWRARGVGRFVAAGELGSGVFFNPVAPEAAAQALREAGPA